MRDTIEMVVKALVDDSDAVDVREIDRNGTTRIEVEISNLNILPRRIRSSRDVSATRRRL